jgi:hypothetical protein
MTSDPASHLPALRSEIKGLRSELSDLRHQVGRVSELNDRMRRMDDAVRDLTRKQAATQDALSSLKEMYERDRIVANAYHELEVAERQRQAKFGRYEDARNMAESIIDVVASGHINRAVILDVTEHLAVQTPRYWVAQATLAVAAWLDDNPGQHRAALEYALALDYEKTSLFMALLLRDQDREAELQEWLAAYLSQLRPAKLPLHFRVVIDAVTGNAFGRRAAPRLVNQVAEWYADEGARQDIFDAAVSEWQRRLLSLGARYGETRDFSLLAANEKAWKVLSPRFAASQATEQAARYFRGRFETGAQVSDDVRGELAALLKKLAKTEDAEEEELSRAIFGHRAITLAEGDREAARQMIVDYERERTSSLNIVAMVSQSAFPRPEDGQPPAPTVTELLGIMFNRDLIVTAARELRSDLPSVGTVEIAVGERPWTCQFSLDDDGTGMPSPGLAEQAKEQTRKVCAQIQKDAARREGRLRWFRNWGCPGGLAAAAGLGASTFIPGAPPELMIPAFVVAVPSILGMSRLPTVVRRAASRTEAEVRAVTDQIGKAASQLGVLWGADRRSATVDLPELSRYLNGLTEDSVGAAIRPIRAEILPKTREFPSWTPQPPPRYPVITGTEAEPPPVDD